MAKESERFSRALTLAALVLGLAVGAVLDGLLLHRLAKRQHDFRPVKAQPLDQRVCARSLDAVRRYDPHHGEWLMGQVPGQRHCVPLSRLI